MIHHIPALQAPEQASQSHVATAVMARLRGEWARPDWRSPTLPSVGHRIVEISQGRRWTADEAAGLLRVDPMFAAQVLRRAAAQAHVRSLGQAVAVLGPEGMRTELLEFAASLRIIQSPRTASAITAIHRSGWRRAEAARAVCRYTSIDTELTATAALMADLGLVAGLIAGCDAPGQLTPPSLDEVWGPVYGGHETIGWFLADAWGLPEELALVIGNHHQLQVGGVDHPVLAALQLADAILGLGLSVERFGTEAEISTTARRAALQVLGMSVAHYRLAREHTRSRLM